MIKLTNIIKEAVTTGNGIVGDAWPDGIFTKPGRERIIEPAGMPRGMTQVKFPAATPIFDSDEERAGELRDDTPPLSPLQRIWNGRGYQANYQIPPESLNYTHLATGDEEGWPWAGSLAPGTAPEAGTPEKTGKGYDKIGYRKSQLKPHSVTKLDKTKRYVKKTQWHTGDEFKTYNQHTQETGARLKNQPKDWWNLRGKGKMQDGTISLKNLLKDILK
jgi:hypothetical protein